MGLYDIYKYVMYDLSDPRMKNDFLLATPWPLITILSLYVYFVRVIGPKFMQNRDPIKIDWIIKIYNVIQIIWNFRMFCFIFDIVRCCRTMADASLMCVPLTLSDDDPLGRVNLQGAWHYSYNKIFDLFDTIFFVLRKKNSQITYTHVYHHIIMSISAWIFSRYGAGGNPTSVGIINVFIHTIMYTYYLLSLMGYGKWLWWKKYLTILQMLQFAIVTVHNAATFVTPCNNNLILSTFATIQGLYFFYLFSLFYVKTYLKEDKRTKKVN